MQVKTVYLNKEKASKLLSLNTNNRTIRKQNISFLADQMKRGLFVENGETLKISKSGIILDGQHRLLAIIEADYHGKFLIVEDVSDDSFSTIDKGIPRKHSDTLGHMGMVNTTKLAAAASAICAWEKTKEFYSHVKIPSEDIIDVVKRYPAIHGYVTVFSGGGSRVNKAGGISAMAGVCTVVDKKYGSEKIHEFLYQWGTGENLSRGMPAFAMRERFLLSTLHSTIHSKIKIAMFAKSLIAHCEGKEMKICKVSESESRQFFI